MIITPGYVCCGPSDVNSFPHYVLGTQEAGDLKITEGERVLVTDRTSDDWWVFFISRVFLLPFHFVPPFIPYKCAIQILISTPICRRRHRINARSTTNPRDSFLSSFRTHITHPL